MNANRNELAAAAWTQAFGPFAPQLPMPATPEPAPASSAGAAGRQWELAEQEV